MKNLLILCAGVIAARNRRRARALGEQLLKRPGRSGKLNSLMDGVIIDCTKVDGRVTVKVVEPPGRLVGFNNGSYLEQSPPGEAYLVTLVQSSQLMGPAGRQPTTWPEEGDVAFPRPLPLGDPLPESAQLWYSGSYPGVFDGGVVFPALYARDPISGAAADNNPMWAVLDVRWAGAGQRASISLSEAFVRGLTGGFGFGAHGTSADDFGARLNVATFANGLLYGAMEVSNEGSIGPTAAPEGRALVICVRVEDRQPVLVWHHVISLHDVPGLEPQSVDGVQLRAGLDLLAILAWLDPLTGENRCVVTARGRTEVPVTHLTGDVTRIMTGQVRADFLEGAATTGVTYLDSMAGADSGLPMLEAETAYIQRYPDTLWLVNNAPMRLRRVTLLVRPPLDASVDQSALEIDARRSMYLMEAGGEIRYYQSALAFGVEDGQPGDMFHPTDSNMTDVFGFSTQVADDELWTWGIRDDGQLQIVSFTGAGLVGGSGPYPGSLVLSTYQREVLDDDGNVVVPMAQVASVRDAGKPKLAIRKGRSGPMDFIPAPHYSNFGTYYLANPVSFPRYGRMFG